MLWLCHPLENFYHRCSLQPVKVEKFENEIDYASSQFPKNPEQNNLKFYNQPIVSDFYVKKPVETHNVKGGYQPYTGTSQSIVPYYAETNQQQHITIPVHSVERFEEKGCTDAECDVYVNHIVQCSKCKAVVMKKDLGLDSDKLINEDIMEILSYLIFGLFILLLIDSLKKKNELIYFVFTLFYKISFGYRLIYHFVKPTFKALFTASLF
jgi:hypothetical protein